MAQAELNVTVTNFNFTKDLLDPTSEAYGAFEELFQRESMRIYGTTSGYEGVRILTLSPGSIVVTHEVFFTLVVPKNVSQDMEDITQGLVQTLKDVEAGQGVCQHETDILCLKVPPDPVIRSMTETSDLDELCRIRAPPGYSQFYFTDTVGGLISCITACTPNRPTSLDCHYGQCRVTLQGPSCFCQDEAFFWYSGPQCSGRISKVATGLGLVATVLLLTCIVLGIIVARERQRRRMLSDHQSSVAGSWYEEDSLSWRSPDGFLYSDVGAGGTIRDPSTRSWGRPSPPQPHRGGGESQRSFTPALEMVDTSVPMKISRPQVATKL
ncbi:mucin-3A-like [Pezoporus occidentalis]|uniref:mucin-3A-like n=1 Tax=Pezoporus occidentalis TaxID=407982 RepID=UPI002F91A43B